MATAGLGVTSLIVIDPSEFRFVSLAPQTIREFHGCDEHVCRASNLFQRQSLCVRDLFCGTQAMSNSSTEQLSDNRDAQVPMHAEPATTLEVIPA